MTVIDSAAAESFGAARMDQIFSGRRMSGQEVTAPLAKLPDVSVGGYTVADHVAGVIDLGSTESGGGFDGILGLDFFANACVTINPVAQRMTVSDSVPDVGIVVPVEIRRDRGSIAMYAPMELPSGQVVTMEVDTGSGALILDDRYLPDCDVAPNNPQIDVRHGVDETGHRYTRKFVTIDGSVRIPGEPGTTQHAPRVMFQRIIYDGLIGTDFLNRFRYTFDVRRQRLVLDLLSDTTS